MDQLIISLGNMGGVAVLAAALFLLLRDTIHRFTRELETTREGFTQELETTRKRFSAELANEREQCHEDHTAMMTALSEILHEVRPLKQPERHP